MADIIPFSKSKNDLIHKSFLAGCNGITMDGNIACVLPDDWKKLRESGIFTAHFIKSGLRISPSLDIKYNFETGRWENAMHFRKVRKNRMIDYNQSEFPGLAYALQKDFLPALIENKFITGQTVYDESSGSDSIRSPNLQDIIFSIHVFLRAAKFQDNQITLDPDEMQKAIDLRRKFLLGQSTPPKPRPNSGLHLIEKREP